MQRIFAATVPVITPVSFNWRLRFLLIPVAMCLIPCFLKISLPLALILKRFFCTLMGFHFVHSHVYSFIDSSFTKLSVYLAAFGAIIIICCLPNISGFFSIMPRSSTSTEILFKSSVPESRNIISLPR